MGNIEKVAKLVIVHDKEVSVNHVIYLVVNVVVEKDFLDRNVTNVLLVILVIRVVNHVIVI